MDVLYRQVSHVTIQFVFLNPIVILLLYTKKIFPLAYLRDVLYLQVNSVGNVVYKNYKSSYCLAFFYFLFSQCNSLCIYRGSFLSVFTDRYMDGKFYQYRSSQHTDIKIMSVFSFVFVNFLIVNHMLELHLKI
jgi:hypothetical protein